MRSRAQFRGHPLHAMLIPFPFAFLVGGVVADLAAVVFDSTDLRIAAWYLFAGGIVMGLVAAVPGLIDYLGTVPPESSAKKRATRHMIVNVTALITFAVCWWLRGGPGVPPDGALLALELAAVSLLGMGGWMGGTLVYRNQIGIDHRYARAGKWKEIRVGKDAPSPVVVATSDELQVDQMKLVHVGDRRIVVARTDDGFCAFSDHCTHKGGSLAGGLMACGTVICPWHGSQFDVRSGAVRAGPAEQAIQTFRVEVVGKEVRLTLG
jgi:nitrite reductase/ring-hydroxylating ferredoxin subunit/uncharacterized membrane protein